MAKVEFNPLLDALIDRMLEDANHPDISLADRCKAADRGLKREAILKGSSKDAGNSAFDDFDDLEEELAAIPAAITARVGLNEPEFDE